MQLVRDDFQAANVTVWTDEAIEPGVSSWKTTVETAIRTADCLVAILSPDAAQSRWVQAELDFAEIQGKQIFLILARGDERTAVPFGYASYQWADIRETVQYQVQIRKLITAIQKITGLTTETATDSAKIKLYKGEIYKKLHRLADDFAGGTISRSQFLVVYERYTSQLTMADKALTTTYPEPLTGVARWESTPYILASHMGKAVGMLVYHNRNQTPIETLGEFTLSQIPILPTLQAIWSGLDPRVLFDTQTQKVSEKQWLVFVVRELTSVITLFHNEPSRLQVREIERLHYDFENANRNVLANEIIEREKLAYPFLVFIRNRIGRP
ncbi:MAG: toll/interleukin-1 receptor domain-containing protein [Taibaiella sp.]|nr:toll/interleukin-1 receptor domain-containing protein [Taibaiella sp.]